MFGLLLLIPLFDYRKKDCRIVLVEAIHSHHYHEVTSRLYQKQN